MEGENLSVLDLTASSSQNSLTGDLTASSSQNSWTGGVVAGSSQNPTPGGGSDCGDSEPVVVVVPGSDQGGCDGNQVAGFSGNCSQVRSKSLYKLSEKDVPGASLNGRDPSQLHVVELKRWLKCRGAATSGRKEELIKRVQDYISSGLDGKIVDPDGGVHVNRLRAEKESKEANYVMPKPLPSEGWTSNLSELPPFSYGSLYAHLVTGSQTVPKNQINSAETTFRAGAMKHKEEGYRLFRDNHVMMVRFNSTSIENYCLFHAFIRPSFKNTGKYSTSVSLGKQSGCVVGAQCNCKAGAGGCCKHVAALLYNILDYVELGLHEIPSEKTCTDQPQQWNRPKGNEPNAPVLFSDIKFVHHTYGKRKTEEYALRADKIKKFRACPPSCNLITEDKLRKFCTSLEANNNATQFTAVIRNNDCKPRDFTNNQIIVQTKSNNQEMPNQEPANPETPEAKVWKRITVNKEQAEYIEANTRAQADSPEWYEERNLRITASNFGRVCRRLTSTSPDALVKLIINQKIYKSMPAACAWGKNNESQAIDLYITTMLGDGHTGVEVKKSGLVINPEYTFLGASPDGLVTDPVSEDHNGLLKIKCPYVHKDCTPLEAAQQKKFFCNLEYGNLSLKKQHHYYYQIQGQMAMVRLCNIY